MPATFARRSSARLAVVAVLALSAAALAPSAAQAGRLVATGHDADNHARPAGNSCDPCGLQQHFLSTTLTWVRGGAPVPGLPVLVLDCNNYVAPAIFNSFGAGAVPTVTECPSSTAFGNEQLSTTKFSAILVGSGESSGGQRALSSSQQTAIAARKGDITQFYNDGGGILALAGDTNGDGSTSTPQTYYSFLPLPVGGKVVTPPFAPTPAGAAALGIQDNPNPMLSDVNCCPTHNSFQEPLAGTELKVAERDGAGAAETLFAEGVIANGKFTTLKPPDPKQVILLPKNKKCVDRRRFVIPIHQPIGNGRVVAAAAYVNGKVKQTISGNNLSQLVVKKLPLKKFKVKVNALTTKFLITSTRTYRGCGKTPRKTVKRRR